MIYNELLVYFNGCYATVPATRLPRLAWELAFRGGNRGFTVSQVVPRGRTYNLYLKITDWAISLFHNL